jgi:hypothetical protein
VGLYSALKFSRRKPPFRHVGTCASDTCSQIVDSVPYNMARLTSFAKFAQGWPVAVESVGASPEEQQLRVLRAWSQIGRPYHPGATCDHLATYAETGEWRSPQIEAWLELLGVGLVGYLAWRYVADN